MNTRKFNLINWLAALLIVSTVFIACNNETEKAKEEPAPAEMKTDSLPALDKTDSLSTTKPETMNN